MASNQTDNERELLLRVAEGDEQAFRELYDIYERLLRPYLADLTKSESNAGDLVQETLLRVWLNRDRLSSLDHPRAYIYRIAANLAYTWLKNQLVRKRSEKISAEDTQVSDEGETSMTVKAIRHVVRQAVNSMPLQRSRIYLMHREQGMKATEIARELGISVSTVKNTLSQALSHIREEVKNAGYYLPVWLLFIFL